MPETVQIVTLPCLTDNYAFLLHDPGSDSTVLVDAPEAGPVKAALDARGWRLTDILLTHHHWDHTDGVAELRITTGAKVWGAKADAARLPPLDHALAEGDTVEIGALKGHVIDVSGHTIGHIAFHFPALDAVFTADSLMALGCGRLFEGTPAQMWDSLSKLMRLPDETMVYSGHDYVDANARFALTIEPDNPNLTERMAQTDAAHAAGEPVVPSSMAMERATNPFLRAALPDVKARLNMSEASDADVFAEIRGRKDRF